MVLRSVLGGGKIRHKVEFVGKEIVRSVSFIFFNFRNILLSARKPAA